MASCGILNLARRLQSAWVRLRLFPASGAPLPLREVLAGTPDPKDALQRLEFDARLERAAAQAEALLAPDVHDLILRLF